MSINGSATTQDEAGQSNGTGQPLATHRRDRHDLEVKDWEKSRTEVPQLFFPGGQIPLVTQS